jgi:DNA polymerase elongation subunit (family B)
MLFHIFDAIARDQILVRETEEEEEIEYESPPSEDDDEFQSRRFARRRGGGAAGAQPRRFVIHLFGTSAAGQTTCIEVRGFTPSFFVELPPTGNPDDHMNTILRRLKSSLEVKGAVVRRKKMIGYTGGRSYVFAQLTVKSMNAFYEARKAFLDETQRPKMRLKPTDPPLRVYEANLDPMLRFFHTRGIAPCGWVSVAGQQVADNHIVCEWDDISPAASGEGGCVSAPLLVGAWDIECYSADGEFPMPKQGYRRVAKQLWAAATSATEAGKMLEEGIGRLGSSQHGTAIIVPPFQSGVVAGAATVRRAVERLAPDLEKAIAARAEAKTGKEREEGVAALTAALDRVFAALPLAGDPVIQIGTVATRGAGAAPERHVFVLGGCADIEGATVHRAATESDLLLDWFGWVVEQDFDVLVGYNTFGFDEHYVWNRLEELRLTDEPAVQAMTRLEGGVVKLTEKMLSSSALGDNLLHLWNTPGRLRIDLYGHIKRKTQLSSYKLDAVCAAFLSGKLSGIEARGGSKWFLKTKQTGDARVGRSLQILDDLGEELSEKMVIVAIEPGGLVVESEEDLSAVTTAVRWAVVKDDVSPADIFRLHRGSDADRATVAAYCIQDCDLVMELYKKLEVFNEAMSMANVCSVPVSYIFTRGQGIKIESLIFRFCAEVGQLVEVMPAAAYGKGAVLEVQDSYEGAIVLDPAAGFYGADTPVGVCDFASLYPSTIISENISHDMLVWTKDFALDGRFLGFRHGCDEDEALAPAGTRFTDIEFDIWRPAADDARKHPVKLRAGTRICRYAQPPGDVKGSLPNIVAKLLAARKAKREELKRTADPFKKALLDAEQNAYKITANSLYGQLGSGTFKIRLQHLAASVTAYGRKQILFAKEVIETSYGSAAADPRCSASVVYGDTDSIFVNFNPRNPETGERLTGREARVATIELTEEAGKFITGALKAPHDFEYDKVFSPFLIFSKKRYVGNKYEESPDEFKETSMGIVLKRRDNAPLLKIIYSAALNRMLNHGDVAGAVDCVKRGVGDLVAGRTKLSQLTITKSLRSEYLTPTPPAHKVLADRMAVRDPGNAPASGERLGYVYIQAPVGQLASKLQGDRVETPAWIVAHGLQADARHYIEHQLMVPLGELFGVVVEQMPGFARPPAGGWSDDADKRADQRSTVAQDLLFREGLAALDAAARRAFVGRMGSAVAAAAAAAGPAAQEPRAKRQAVVRPPPIKQTQTSLTQFMKPTPAPAPRDTAMIDDGFIAASMGRAQAARKAAKPKADGTVMALML